MLEIEKERLKPRLSARDFLLAARQDPSQPIEKTICDHDDDPFRLRNVLVTLNYVFGDGSFDDYREMAGGVSDKRVQQIVKKTLKTIWTNSSADLQKQYPLENIKPGHGFTLKSAIERSKARSGALVAILNLVGSDDPNEQMKKMGFSSRQICEARVSARKWGYQVPSVNCTKTDSAVLAQNLEEVQNDNKVQRLLSSGRLYFCQENCRGQDSLLITLKEAVSGYHVSPRNFAPFAGALKKTGVPLTVIEREISPYRRHNYLVQRYYFLLRRDLDRARGAFLSDSTLEKFRENPVTQTCGPKVDKLPNTTDIQRSGNFKHPSALLRELGIEVKGRWARYRLAQFLTDDCPIPVFRYRGLSYYPSVYQDQLMEFFKTRANTIK